VITDRSRAARSARRGQPVLSKEAIRLELGRSLALALEFQLGADILGTALNPSLQDILTLGAIVILRTVLNFFLGRELKDEANRVKAGDHDTLERGSDRPDAAARNEGAGG